MKSVHSLLQVNAHFYAQQNQWIRNKISKPCRKRVDIGIFQDFLEAIHFRTMGVDQLATIPREITEVANLDGWNEAAPEESMLQEFGDPAAILHVRLAPGDLF